MVRRRAGKNAIPAREANGVAIANNVKMVANPPTMPTHPKNVGSTFWRTTVQSVASITP